MKKYNRIMLGRGSKFASMCREEGYIGANFEIFQDLTGHLPDNWRDFNAEFIPIYMKNLPGKSKTAAGLACSFLWTIAKGLKVGDIVLSPTGSGSYYVGKISSDYYYAPGTELPHRRKVDWMDVEIARKSMTQKLKNASGAIGTCCDISNYADEIEALIAGKPFVVIPKEVVTVKEKNFTERSLHKLFCNYLRTRDIYAKTIFHEKSTKSDQAQKWVHPDIVGAQFEEFKSEETLSLLKATEPKESVHIYSFELKRKIESDLQLKQYFFQALSNSSWANYGYLVAFEIADDLEEEMARLNNAFGIGIIHMQPTESKVLFQARMNRLDYTTIEKLNNINTDFNTFINKLSKVLMASKDYTTDALLSFQKICDPIFSTDEEIEAYCKDNDIPF